MANPNFNLQPPKIPIKMVNCFRCNKEFGVKWVIGRQAYSQKNSWAYWTGETEGDKQICSNCLINFYRNDKQLFWEKVKGSKKKKTIANYISIGSLVAD